MADAATWKKHVAAWRASGETASGRQEAAVLDDRLDRYKGKGICATTYRSRVGRADRHRNGRLGADGWLVSVLRRGSQPETRGHCHQVGSESAFILRIT